MPTYDYRCSACAHAFEHFQSITAAPLKRCPECGREALQRLIGTGGGVLFKGSGFYQTDYRSPAYARAAAAEAKAAGGGSSGGDGAGPGSGGGSAGGDGAARPSRPAGTSSEPRRRRRAGGDGRPGPQP